MPVASGDFPIVLSWPEVILAASVGVMRNVTNLRDRRRDAHGLRSDDLGWQHHIEGACGECAFAKFAGLFWSGAVGNLTADDVGPWQVRTRTRDDYQLIVHQSDPDDRRFVLVRGRCPRYAVVGWIWGRDAKRHEWWADPKGGRPAYFVPDEALTPLVKVAAPSMLTAQELRW